MEFQCKKKKKVITQAFIILFFSLSFNSLHNIDFTNYPFYFYYINILITSHVESIRLLLHPN